MNTLSLDHSSDLARRASDRSRIGGIAALVQAGTFAVGIAMFASIMSDYVDPDSTTAERVDFLVGHQGSLFVWQLVTLIVFGIALVPLTLALYDRLRGSGFLASAGAAFGLIWSGLVLATGMISNIGLRTISDLADTDPAQAQTVWSALDAVTNGLGGGNELAGGVWVLLVSVAALRVGAFSRSLNWVGIVSAVAGVATVIPGLEVFELVFGLGLIVWFVWIGVALLRDGSAD